MRKDKDSDDYGSIASKPNGLQDEEQLIELNEIYEIVGIGPAQYIYWTLVVLVGYSEYAELTCLSLVLPALQCQWGLSTTFQAAITMSTFGSYALTGMVMGNISDKYGRKKIMIYSILNLFTAGILGAAAPNKWVFLASRLMTGAAIGANMPSIACYATEFAESKYRAIGITVWQMAAFAGVVIVNGVAWLVLRSLGWRWFIIIICLPAIPALAMMITLPDSPRYLCASGQQDKAMQAVRFMARLNGTRIPENIKMVCFNNTELGSYSMLLNEVHRRSTMSLSAIYFSNIFLEFGLIMFLPLLFRSNACGTTELPSPPNCNPLSQENLMDLTITSVASFGGTILGLLLATRIGRLMPIRIANAAQVLSVATLFVCINSSVTFGTAIVVRTVEAFINTVIWIIIPESFPTSIRSTATGFVNGWGKIGGVFGTGFVSMLFYVSHNAVIGLFVAASFMGFVGTLFFNRETRDVVLLET